MWYGGVQSRKVADPLPYLTKALMSKRVRTVTGCSVVLVGSLVAKRLSALVGVTPCIGSLKIGSTKGAASAKVGFAFISMSGK